MDSTKNLKDQLKDYHVRATAASSEYYEKSNKIFELGYQGTENLSPEGVGAIVAIGGLVAKMAFCGARLLEATGVINDSSLIEAASVPLNAVAGIAFLAGTTILVGSMVRDKVASKIQEKGIALTEHAEYAEAAYHALKDGTLNLPEGATVEDALNAVRDLQIAEHMANGGTEEDIKDFYPEINMEKAEGLISDVEEKKPEEFAEAEVDAVAAFEEREKFIDAYNADKAAGQPVEDVEQ